MPGLPLQDGSNTALTPEVFQRWKEARETGLRRAREAAAAQRQLDLDAGKVAPTGKELFERNPELFADY
ncbi:hypothetical protein WJX74_007982 [Apatococcus lobatus]|uniref:ZC3H15/TMA46 family C-terminal domain-containing protein n=1 Tax=Apatococcus lobatus TaxID=904363 RepID=A0AAW1QUK9_9CHLO